MARFAATTHTGCCPYIDDGDRLCESHFSLGRLSEAFGDCFGNYRQCPAYARLSRLDAATDADPRVAAHAGPVPADPPTFTPIELTLHGRRLQSSIA